MRKFMITDDCCKDNPSNGDQPKDCLTKWEEELKDVCNQYNIIAAETSKHKESYDNSYSWEAKLKNWCNLIETTDLKAKEVVLQLDFLLEQLRSVCEKSECTVTVLEKLICLVKTIFDCFYVYDNGKEGLKERISAFKEAIKCLKNLGQKDKEEIIKCIEAYEEKIIEACEMQDAVLTKLLETLKCANLLCTAICGEGGLEDKLEGIRDGFNGTTNTPVEDDNCDPEDENNGPKYPCNDKEAKPLPEFPIIEDEENKKGNAYYEKVKQEFETATAKTRELKEKWVDSKKYSDKVLAEKFSLTEAIAAANAAKTK